MMMRNRFKKLFAMFSVLITMITGFVGILGTAAPVWASESDAVPDFTKSNSLTIYKYDITAALEDEKEEPFVSTGEEKTDAQDYFADYAIGGVEFSYLKVSDVRQYIDSDNTVEFVYKLDSTLMTTLGLTNDDAALIENNACWFSGDDINTAMATALENNTATKNILEKYMETKSATKMTETDENGKTVKEGLNAGLYLIVETMVPENVSCTTDPWFVQLPMTDSEGTSWLYDVYCYPKNQTDKPTLDKLVKPTIAEADAYDESTYATSGEVLDYFIVSKIPNITSESTYLTKYSFKDTLSPGLSYNKDAVVAIYDSAETAKADSEGESATALWSEDDGNYSIAYETKSDKNSVMTVEITEDGLEAINENYTGKYLVIHYTAVLNTDDSCVIGGSGNPNTVKLEYSRTNTESTDTLDDSCVVKSLALIVEKKFDGSFTKTDVSKVKFTLFNATKNYYVTAVSDKSAAGEYYVITPEENGGLEEEEETEEEGSGEGGSGEEGSGEEGSGEGETEEEETEKTPYEFVLCADDKSEDYRKLVIYGLGNDDWKLTEIQTAPGYSLLKEKIDVDLSADIPESGEVNITVINKEGFTLPRTGGPGLYLITIVGIIIAALGFFLYVKKAKDEHKDNA